MNVEANKVVSFHYRMREPGGEVMDDSRDGAPVVYLHGHGGMLKGLEEALVGKQKGDHVDVTLSPEQAYGERRADSIARVSVKHVLQPRGKKSKFAPGMVVQVNTAQGPRDVVVVKAGLKTLDVDTNHPLSGKTLSFEIDVIDVRDASPEEVEHGHVHGEGGHHH